MKALPLLIVLALASPSFAQTPAPTPTPADPVAVLNPLDKLERENVILMARIAQLESQLAQATQAVRSADVQKRAAEFIAKINKDYKDKLTINPETLELKVAEAPKKPN